MLKHLAGICAALWALPWALKHFYPEQFGVWYFQWPAFLLLCVLLPSGLAKSLRQAEHHQQVMAFLVIFIGQSALLGIGYNMLTGSAQLIAITTEVRLPANMALAAISSQFAEERVQIASMIYRETGQPVLVKDGSGQKVIYQPTQSDRAKYAKVLENMHLKGESLRQIQARADEVFYLSAVFYGSFLLIFTGVFYQGAGRQKRA